MGVKYSVNESYFDSWNSHMAYVLGYLYADGSLENASYLRGKYVRVSSVERDSIERIKKSLESEHKIVSEKSNYLNGRTRYLLRIGSHKIYDSLEKLGLYPNKSLTVRFPNVPKKYLGDFVRGYFDGDGCVSLSTARGEIKPIIVKKLSIIFSSGSYEYLEEMRKVLNGFLKLNLIRVYKSQRVFQLRYNSADSVKLFRFMYRKISHNLYLPRKYRIFRDFFGLSPKHIDIQVKNILHSINGRVAK